LPGFVGEVGFEAEVGGAGAFFGLFGHESVAAKNFPDCRWCGACAVVSFEVGGDGVWAGVVAGSGQLVA
jgi:hypothetical protein